MCKTKTTTTIRVHPTLPTYTLRKTTALTWQIEHAGNIGSARTHIHVCMQCAINSRDILLSLYSWECSCSALHSGRTQNRFAQIACRTAAKAKGKDGDGISAQSSCLAVSSSGRMRQSQGDGGNTFFEERNRLKLCHHLRQCAAFHTRIWKVHTHEIHYMYLWDSCRKKKRKRKRYSLSCCWILRLLAYWQSIGETLSCRRSSSSHRYRRVRPSPSRLHCVLLWRWCQHSVRGG